MLLCVHILFLITIYFISHQLKRVLKLNNWKDTRYSKFLKMYHILYVHLLKHYNKYHEIAIN